MPSVATSSTNEVASATSHAITMASGITSGDFLVAGLLVGANTGSQTFNTPSGWTKQEESLEQFARQYAIYTKTAAGSDTITVTTGVAGPSICFCIRVTDHNGYGASDKSTSPGFDSSETSPSVAVSASSSLALVGHMRSGNESATITEPGSTTSLIDHTWSAQGLRVTIVTASVSPASTGTFAWSWSGDGWNQAWTLVAEAADSGTTIAVPTGPWYDGSGKQVR